MSTHVVAVDLGQSQDYTAISILERAEDLPVAAKGLRPQICYHLRYLARPPLGTPYPVIVATVLGLLDREPLSRKTPLVVDKTGCGAAVVDMFAAAGLHPYAVTITGGSEVNRDRPHDLKVPKKELASTLVALYQGERLKVAKGLALADALVAELQAFKVKINIATGHESFEAWRERDHDDLVLSVALACWYAEQHKPAPIVAPLLMPRPRVWRSEPSDGPF